MAPVNRYKPNKNNEKRVWIFRFLPAARLQRHLNGRTVLNFLFPLGYVIDTSRLGTPPNRSHRTSSVLDLGKIKTDRKNSITLVEKRPAKKTYSTATKHHCPLPTNVFNTSSNPKDWKSFSTRPKCTTKAMFWASNL